MRLIYRMLIMGLCCWTTVRGSAQRFQAAGVDQGVRTAQAAMQTVPAVVAPGVALQTGGQFFQAGVLPNGQPISAAAASATPLTVLSSACVDNFTCAAIPNSYCSPNHTCQCMSNFIEDPVFTGTCRLAPGYNEMCAVGQSECRQPFICNASGMCDCKPGFLQEYFQCVKDCPPNQVPVGDVCMPAKQLDEKCESSEQCMQAYSQCLHGKCQCIPGTNHLTGQCYPVNQCPLGEPAKDKKGKVQMCTTDSEEVCAKDYYCLHAEIGSQTGFCCPKIKMNCPIGQPLEGHNCTNCPWETHHCFSYVIGSYTETMCCPNACPASHPIQKDAKCYAKSAYGGHCMVDEQCYNVLGASCRKDKDGKNRCLCPAEGNFRNYYGRCLKEAGLGEDCTTNEECKQGTNTLCTNGVCGCFNGYIPEPPRGRSSPNAAPQRCIAEPACPTAVGLKPVESYTECSDDSKGCKENEFCRRWWNEANHTYSLCCVKPKTSDYDAMCKPFRMKLVTATVAKKVEPLRCDITSLPPQFFVNDAVGNTSVPLTCPTGASCLFDPYNVDKGICCKPDESIAAAPSGSATSQGGNNQAHQPHPAATSAKTGSATSSTSTTGSTSSSKSVTAASTAKASTAKMEEIEEEESTVDMQQKSTPSTASTKQPASPQQTNSSLKVVGTNIPVVRIRGFHNNNQQG